MSVKRIQALRKQIKKESLDAYLVANIDNIRYLTGFTGSSGLLVVGDRSADFFTDSRYTVQARKQVRGARIHKVESRPLPALAGFARLFGKNLKVGYCGDHLTVGDLNILKIALPGALLVEVESIEAELGWVKDREEIVCIAKAVHIADIAFERVLQIVLPGIREKEIAAELEYQMTMLGSEAPAFETIVASGYRSAMPHGAASSKKVRKGDLVTFDFGATVSGYVSDMTRTIVVGKATARQKRIYNLVLKAQKAGIRKIKAGVKAAAVDDACRNLIRKAGFGKYFEHGTGHGIGFYIHMGPRLAPKSQDLLKVNNVVTVEPGVYIPKWGGVRIEDDIVVTRTGGRILNQTPKKLLEL